MFDDKAYVDWLLQIKDLRGGWLGLIVVLVTLACVAAGIWFGIGMFPAGNYPQAVLALPGLALGAAGFLISSSLLWRFKKSR